MFITPSKKFTSYLKLTILVLVASVAALRAQPVRQTERSKWFTDARFGTFIHFGLYSFFEGKYNGELLRNPYPMLYSEWIQQHNRIPTQKYIEYAKNINLTDKEVDEWVLMSKQAGAKYMILTTKHHDGLALWPSRVSRFNLPVISGRNFDVVGSYVKACRKYGMKVGFYYSHWLDWEDPNATGHFEIKNYSKEKYKNYWHNKCMPQVAELIKTYKPDLFWFDNWTPIDDKGVITNELVYELLAMIRKMDNNIVVNGRLGIPEKFGNEVNAMDYKTVGDNEIPKERITVPWETAGTVNNAWGHHEYDEEYRSTSRLIRILVTVAANGGNYALNFGPMYNGQIHPEVSTRFKQIGDWLKVYGESVYGTNASPFNNNVLDFGKVTTKTEDGKEYLYLHVFHWPVDGVLRLHGLKNKVLAATIVGSSAPIKAEQSGLALNINVPSVAPSYYDTPIKLLIEGKPEIQEWLVQPTMQGGYSLNVFTSPVVKGAQSVYKRDGKIPANISSWKTGSEVSWNAYFPEAGSYSMQISYAADTSYSGKSFQILVDGKSAGAFKTENTGSDREYLSYNLGGLMIIQPGIHKITLRPENAINKEFMKLNWIYIKK